MEKLIGITCLSTCLYIIGYTLYVLSYAHSAIFNMLQGIIH